MHSHQQEDPTARKGNKPEEPRSTGQRSFISAVGLLIKVSWQVRTCMKFGSPQHKVEEDARSTAQSVFQNKNLVTKRKFREIVNEARLSHIENVLLECPVDKLKLCVKTIKASGWYRRNKDVSDDVIVRSLDARLAMMSNTNDSHTLPGMFRIFSARCLCNAEISDSLFSNIQTTNIDGNNAGTFLIQCGVTEVSKHFKNHKSKSSFGEDCEVLSSLLSCYHRHDLVPFDGFKEKFFGKFSQSLSQYYLSHGPLYFKDVAPGLKLHLLYEFYDKGIGCNISSLESDLAKFFSKSLLCWLGEYYVNGDSVKSFRTVLEIAHKSGINDETLGNHIKNAFYSAFLGLYDKTDISQSLSYAVGVLVSSNSISPDEASIINDILVKFSKEQSTGKQFFSKAIASDAFCNEVRSELNRTKGKRDLKSFLDDIIARSKTVKGFSLEIDSKESYRLIAKILNCFSLELKKVKLEAIDPLNSIHAKIEQFRKQLESLFGDDVFIIEFGLPSEQPDTTFKHVIYEMSNLIKAFRLCIAHAVIDTDGNLCIERDGFFKSGSTHIEDIKKSISSYRSNADANADEDED